MLPTTSQLVSLGDQILQRIDGADESRWWEHGVEELTEEFECKRRELQLAMPSQPSSEPVWPSIYVKHVPRALNDLSGEWMPDPDNPGQFVVCAQQIDFDPTLDGGLATEFAASLRERFLRDDDLASYTCMYYCLPQRPCDTYEQMIMACRFSDDCFRRSCGEVGEVRELAREVIRSWTEFARDFGPDWSEPMTLGQIALLLDWSQKTLRRRYDAGKIRLWKLSRESYCLDLNQLPQRQRERLVGQTRRL